jgi:hypothetical protein
VVEEQREAATLAVDRVLARQERHVAAGAASELPDAEHYEDTRAGVSRTRQPAIQWSRDGVGQIHEVGLCNVSDKKDHVARRSKGHD